MITSAKGNPIRTDGQVSITLFIHQGCLVDVTPERISYSVYSNGLVGGIDTTYELHIDIREMLGWPIDSELVLDRLTPEENDRIAETMISLLCKLKDHQIDVGIDYDTSRRRGMVSLRGEGVKGLTMCKIMDILKS